MQTDQHIIYQEKQKLKRKDLLIIFGPGVVIFLIMVLGMFFFTPRPVFWLTLGFGTIFLTWMYLIITPMGFEFSVSKQGVNYGMLYAKIFKSRIRFLSWEKVGSIQITTYPFGVTRYGLQIGHKSSSMIKLGYKGEAYVMISNKIGIELILLDGEKKFFTCKEPDEFLKAVNKLELKIQIIK